MTDNNPTTPKSAINLSDLTIKASSGVAIYWMIDKFMSNDSGYQLYLKVGLVGASGLTVLAPIFNNMMSGKNLLEGIIFDKAILKNMLTYGSITAGLFAAIKYVFNDQIEDSMLYKYLAVVTSIIGSDMLSDVIVKKLF